MEKHIAERFNTDILHDVAAHFATDSEHLLEKDGFESFIYEYDYKGKAYILRIGHSLRRPASLIHAELDWINYLARGGAQVASAIPSARGNLIETYPDGYGDHFMATAFNKAPGGHHPLNKWTPAFMEHYGEVIGSIHRLSQDYHPANPDWQRPVWGDATWLEDVLEWSGTNHSLVNALLKDTYAHIDRLPRDETFRLVHHDAHGGNFFVDDNERITLFDFDDCCYSWYADDIAIVLFYAIAVHPDAKQFTETFMPHFLTGYSRQHELDPMWLAEIPLFLKLRELELFVIIERDLDWRSNPKGWDGLYMENREERITQGLPYVDVDFMRYANLLA